MSIVDKNFLLRAARFLIPLGFVATMNSANACNISEDMTSSLPLNTTEISNSDRIKIANMIFAAKQWPDAAIRGIVYAGGYVKERNPKALAAERATVLKRYLAQLGVKQANIWIDVRIIKKPDVDDVGNAVLNQISVSLVPICEGGCARLCDDPRVTPNTKLIQRP